MFFSKLLLSTKKAVGVNTTLTWVVSFLLYVFFFDFNKKKVSGFGHFPFFVYFCSLQTAFSGM